VFTSKFLGIRNKGDLYWNLLEEFLGIPKGYQLILLVLGTGIGSSLIALG
jgi:hypothetical protein